MAYKKPESSAQAKILARELKALGVELKHTQALELIAKLSGDKNLHVHQAREDAPGVDVDELAREHAASLLFVSTGRYGQDYALLTKELEAAFSHANSRDIEAACYQLFEAPGALKLRRNIEYAYRRDELVELFHKTVNESKRLIERTLSARALRPASGGEVLFEGPMPDWRVGEARLAKRPGFYSEDDLAELGERALRDFQVSVKKSGCQLYVDIALPHGNPEESAGSDQLSLFIEVNEGLPCVHVTNAMYGDQLVSIFGTSKGLFLRREHSGVQLTSARSAPFGAALAEELNCEDDYFIENDNR